MIRDAIKGPATIPSSPLCMLIDLPSQGSEPYESFMLSAKILNEIKCVRVLREALSVPDLQQPGLPHLSDTPLSIYSCTSACLAGYIEVSLSCCSKKWYEFLSLPPFFTQIYILNIKIFLILKGRLFRCSCPHKRTKA